MHTQYIWRLSGIQGKHRESRWALVGMGATPRLLTVVYTLRREVRIRLISARKATRKEAKFHAAGRDQGQGQDHDHARQ
jgi:uncharacterized DUF497 family protein